MALETKTMSIQNEAYTLIGTAVTNLTARSRGNRAFSVVAVATGGGVPAVGTTDIVTVKGENFSYNSVSADIYALSTVESDKLEIMRA